MNTQQRQAEIEHIARQVIHRALPNTRELPDGFYVVKVQGGFARHVPFRDVLAQELAAVMDLLAATRPDVAAAVAEWEASNG